MRIIMNTNRPYSRLFSTGLAVLKSGSQPPSAIVDGEFNYLLNPLHPDLSKLQIHGPDRFSIDKRLVKN